MVGQDYAPACVLGRLASSRYACPGSHGLAAAERQVPQADGCVVSEAPVTIDCKIHGTTVGCVVCCHLVETEGRRIGFVENSDDPNDLQAWSQDCERVYLEERDQTPRFLDFCNAKMVCTGCYATYKERHGAEAS